MLAVDSSKVAGRNPLPVNHNDTEPNPASQRARAIMYETKPKQPRHALGLIERNTIQACRRAGRARFPLD